jgi:hypothetical protein
MFDFLILLFISPSLASTVMESNNVLYVPDPSVAVIQSPRSTWGWTLNPPVKPLQPNPISPGTIGRLIYRADIYKNPSGSGSNMGVFSIRGTVCLRPWILIFAPFRNNFKRVVFENMYVIFRGPYSGNVRYDVAGCVPWDRTLSMESTGMCDFNIDSVSIRGQIRDKKTISFRGYFLQPYVTIRVFNDSFQERVMDISGSVTELELPGNEDDCATFSQTFVSGSENAVQTTSLDQNSVICSDTRLSWSVDVRFDRWNCGESNSTSFEQQLISDIRLQASPSIGNDDSTSLFFSGMKTVAYLNCSN